MSNVRTFPRPPARAHELLHHALALVEQAVFTNPTGAGVTPHLVAVRWTAHGVAIGLSDLAGGDPILALQGFSVPPDWAAAGVVAPGEARRTDDPAAGRDRPWPVDVIHLVARAGPSVSAYRTRSGPGAATVRSEGDGTAWAGLIDDHLRRALGRATAPAPPSSIGLWTAMWLDAVVTAAAGGELTGASWADVVDLHPALLLAREAGAGPGVLAWARRDIVHTGRLLAGTWTWSRLREAAACDEDILGTVRPDVARWMDDGTYARLHLAMLPGPDELLAVLGGLLDARTVERLGLACRAWSAQA